MDTSAYARSSTQRRRGAEWSRVLGASASLRRWGPLVAFLLLAGCLAQDAPADASPAPGGLGAKPTMSKFSFDATAPPSSPLDAVTGAPKPASHPLEVPAGTGGMLLAVDVSPPAERAGANAGEVTVSVLDASGKEIHAFPRAAQPGKLYADVASPPAGKLTVQAKTTGAWKVGVVATFFPEGYQEGIEVDIASRDATEVTHDFRPKLVEAKANAPTRITLYDYDPHEGIENLQHNLRFLDASKVPQKTEGKTTWGEVRVLDFTTPGPGEYEFECEFHGFKGTLSVS